MMSTEFQTLAADVRLWVDRCFDYIPLRVAEQLTDGALYEHIDPPYPMWAYPMWGTLFHYRERGHDGFIEAAKKAGFIVIEGVPEFDGVMLGVQGAGHPFHGYSFHEPYWIPLYVALFDTEGKYEKLSFNHRLGVFYWSE